jgi:hypothetical protein
MAEKIGVILIIEMLGKPIDYLKNALSSYIDKMQEDKSIKVISRKINEPKKIEDSQLLTSFAEVEIEIESLNQLLNIIFTYMPSHIEIVSPETIEFRNHEMNALCNELTRRMLEYDNIAKKMLLERSLLEEQLQAKGEKPILEKIEKNQSAKKSIKKKKKR